MECTNKCKRGGFQENLCVDSWIASTRVADLCVCALILSSSEHVVLTEKAYLYYVLIVPKNILNKRDGKEGIFGTY